MSTTTTVHSFHKAADPQDRRRKRRSSESDISFTAEENSRPSACKRISHSADEICSQVQTQPTEEDLRIEEVSASDTEFEHRDEMVMAGYENCQREILRFLIEEEKLDESHPLIQQLQQHLERQKASLDCRRIVEEFVETDNDSD